MTNDKIDDQIREILHNIPERLKVAEEGVDFSLQQEYLEYTQNLDFNQYSEEDISAKSQSLFSSSTPHEDKKEILVILAHRGTVESYRTIEKFLEAADQKLEAWSVLSLQECRMFLESSLLGRSEGMLMTGLGGENNKLRYFLIIRSRSDVAFTSAQKTTVERAFSSICDRFDSVLEEIQVHLNYATMKVLIPLDVAVGEVIEKGIGESNKFGDFLDPYYFVTNVKIPKETEIMEYLREIKRDIE